MVVEGRHHIWVEAQDVAVANAVGDTVAVQALAEYHGGGGALLLVLVEDWCAREAEEQRVGERAAYVLEHLAEGGAVALVDDEHDPLGGQTVELRLGNTVLAGLHVAHFLDRGHDEAVLGVDARELRLQHLSVLGPLHVVGVVGERAVLGERLRAQLYAVHQKDHLVGVVRVGYELGRFEARHGLAGAGGMPYVAAGTPRGAALGFLVPFASAHLIGYGGGRVILVAAHDLQAAVRAVGHGIEADELVRHGDGEHRGGESLPFAGSGFVARADGLVVEVLPVKIEVRVERARARIGKVQRFIGSHSHEDLDQAEEPREHALVGVLLYLAGGLADGDAAALKLDVDDGHAVDEQTQVAATVVQDLALRRVDWLLSYLVAALAGCDLLAIVDFQAHLLAQVERIVGVVARDGDGLSVDEPVERERGLERFYLFDDLCHLALGERAAIQAVDIRVVLKQNLRPVLKEVLLGGIAQDAVRIVPSVLLQHGDDSFFERSLFIVNHRRNLSSKLLKVIHLAIDNDYKT